MKAAVYAETILMLVIQCNHDTMWVVAAYGLASMPRQAPSLLI